MTDFTILMRPRMGYVQLKANGYSINYEGSNYPYVSYCDDNNKTYAGISIFVSPLSEYFSAYQFRHDVISYVMAVNLDDKSGNSSPAAPQSVKLWPVIIPDFPPAFSNIVPQTLQTSFKIENPVGMSFTLVSTDSPTEHEGIKLEHYSTPVKFSDPYDLQPTDTAGASSGNFLSSFSTDTTPQSTIDKTHSNHTLNTVGYTAVKPKDVSDLFLAIVPEITPISNIYSKVKLYDGEAFAGLIYDSMLSKISGLNPFRCAISSSNALDNPVTWFPTPMLYNGSDGGYFSERWGIIGTDNASNHMNSLPVALVGLHSESKHKLMNIQIKSDKEKNNTTIEGVGNGSIIITKSYDVKPIIASYYMGKKLSDLEYPIGNFFSATADNMIIDINGNGNYDYVAFFSHEDGVEEVDIISAYTTDTCETHIAGTNVDAGLVLETDVVHKLQFPDNFALVMVYHKSDLIKNKSGEYLFKNGVGIDTTDMDVNTAYNLTAITMDVSDYGCDAIMDTLNTIVVPEISRGDGIHTFYQEETNSPLSNPNQVCYPALYFKGVNNEVDLNYVGYHDYASDGQGITSIDVYHMGQKYSKKTDVVQYGPADTNAVTLIGTLLRDDLFMVGDHVVLSGYDGSTRKFFNAKITGISETIVPPTTLTTRIEFDRPIETTDFDPTALTERYLYAYTPITFLSDEEGGVVLDTRIEVISKDGFKSNQIMLTDTDVDLASPSNAISVNYGSWMYRLQLDKNRVKTSTEDFTATIRDVFGMMNNDELHGALISANRPDSTSVYIPTATYKAYSNGLVFNIDETCNDPVIKEGIYNIDFMAYMDNNRLAFASGYVATKADITTSSPSQTPAEVVSYKDNSTYISLSNDPTTDKTWMVVSSPLPIEGVGLILRKGTTSSLSFDISTHNGTLSAETGTDINSDIYLIEDLSPMPANKRGALPSGFDKTKISYNEDLYYVLLENRAGGYDYSNDHIKISSTVIITEGYNRFKGMFYKVTTYNMENDIVDDYQTHSLTEDYQVSIEEGYNAISMKPIGKKHRTVSVSGTAYTKDPTTNEFVDIVKLRQIKSECENDVARVEIAYGQGLLTGILTNLHVSENTGEMVAEWSADIIIEE